MADRCDIAIVGGGLVGSSLAAALAPLGWRVALIEAQTARASAPAWDERNLALARRSVQALESLGVWTHAAAEAHPIVKVRVTSRGDFGAVRIDAADYGLPSLGHTVPARALGAALESRLASLSTLRRIAPATVVALEPGDDSLALVLERGGARERLAARLVVAADGSDSFLRGALGIAAREHDYGQTAIVATVVPTKPHGGVAYERFTDTGPIALLPLAQDRAALVYSVRSDDAERMLALDDAAFLAAATERSAAPLGALRRIGRRQRWPLRRVEAAAVVARRAVVVGNAAQTLHPIGAQGFNLGVRDVLALAQRLPDPSADPGDAAQLERYSQERAPDREATMRISDLLVRGFAPDRELARLARGVAFATLDRMPAAKRELAFAMMGYR